MSTDTATETATTLSQRMIRTALASVLTAAAVLTVSLGALILYFAPVLQVVGGGELAIREVVAGHTRKSPRTIDKSSPSNVPNSTTSANGEVVA